MKSSFFISIIILFLIFPLTAYLQYDPLVEKQWYLEKVDAFDAWNITKGDRDVVVAVLDIGVDISHPDLAQNIWINMDEVGGDGIDNDNNGYVDDVNGWDFIYDWANVRPDILLSKEEIMHHGTMISGIIAAPENGRGISGVASNVKIMPLKVLDEFGYGGSKILAEAIDYAVENGADVINLSLSGFEMNAKLLSAIDKAQKQGVIFVAAAGNGWFEEGFDLESDPMYPICYDSEEPNMFVLGVGSSNKNDQASVFSNFGKECIDITAPGENMFSTKIHDLASTKDEYYGNQSSGTSFAAAVVSGAIALIKSINKSISVENIVRAFEKTSEPIELSSEMEKGDMGTGRINVFKSLSEILVKYGRSESKSPWSLVVAPESKGRPSLKILNKSLEKDQTVEIFKSDFTDGLVMEIGDVNDDGINEYIVGPAKGSPAMLRIFSLDGRLLTSKIIYSQKYLGGFNLGLIKMKDNSNKILVCTKQGRKTEAAIFDFQANKLKAFVPFNDNNGCAIDGGDVDGDGIEEIVISSLLFNEIKIFDQDNKLENSFVAYDDNFNGVNVDVVDINQDGKAEIMAGPNNGKSLLKVFDEIGREKISFICYDENFISGIRVGATDFDNEDGLEIVTVPAKGGGPHLRIFDLLGKVKAEKFVYPNGFDGGLNITTGF